MKPDEWLCAALSVGDAAKNFKVVEIKERGSLGVAVKVRHKESGAEWLFTCRTLGTCSHGRVHRGANSPRVHGSWRTQVCSDCGAFRTHGHNIECPDPLKPLAGHPWRPADEYADEVKIEDDE